MSEPYTRRRSSQLIVVAHEVGPYGGQESAIQDLVLDYCRQGLKVHVLAFVVSDEVRVAANTTLIPRPNGPFLVRFLWFYFAASIKLTSLNGFVITCGAITLKRPDAIWLHFWHGENLRKTKWFCSWPGNAIRFISQSLSRVLAYAAEWLLLNLGRSPMVVSVSESQAHALRKIYPHFDIYVLPNPVLTLDSFPPNPGPERPKPKEILFVGGQWGHKGLKIVAEAADLLGKQRDCKIRLTILGRGSTAVIEKLQAMSHLEIEHVLWSDDVSTFMYRADVFAIASRHETFSMAGHEALALGLPVITTDVHGLGDSVRQSGLGKICERSVLSYRQALEQVLFENPLDDDCRRSAKAYIASSYGKMAISELRMILAQHMRVSQK